jgi:hypothetical protein
MCGNGDGPLLQRTVTVSGMNLRIAAREAPEKLSKNVRYACNP